MLEFASHSQHGPIPNLFLAAVHYLLLKDGDHALANFYPDIKTVSDRDGDPFPSFREFCLKNSEAINELLQTRLVQTNEVQRSALLLPAFQFVTSRTKAPLSVVEIGASAGLNLLWDKYAYDYGKGTEFGDEKSEVKLTCELRGERSFVSRELPVMKFAAGIDLNPLDVTKDDDMLWLKALVWPEHSRRLSLLESAVRVAKRQPPKLLKGDALEILPRVIESSPRESTTCIVSTFTLNQFPKESREKPDDLFAQEAMKREFCFVFVEYVDNPRGAYPELHTIYRKEEINEDSHFPSARLTENGLNGCMVRDSLPSPCPLS